MRLIRWAIAGLSYVPIWVSILHPTLRVWSGRRCQSRSPRFANQMSSMGHPFSTIMAAGRLPTHELARNPSLQLAATLSKPFAVEALLDTVNNALRATVRPRAQTNSLPIWQSQPSAVGCQL